MLSIYTWLTLLLFVFLGNMENNNVVSDFTLMLAFPACMLPYRYIKPINSNITVSVWNASEDPGEEFLGCVIFNYTAVDQVLRCGSNC